MIVISFTLGLRQLPAATTAWHLCTVIIPRRTITGRLVRGKVRRATMAVTGYTRNSSLRGWRHNRQARAMDENRRTPRALLTPITLEG
jgi:hypothetical protein